jgi:hypothetical protein
MTTPHLGHLPLMALRPFFINSSTASAISLLALHFTQYPSAIIRVRGFPHAPSVRAAVTYGHLLSTVNWESSKLHNLFSKSILPINHIPIQRPIRCRMMPLPSPSGRPHFPPVRTAETEPARRDPLATASREGYVAPRFWKGRGSLPTQVGGGKSEHRRARCRVTVSGQPVTDTRGEAVRENASRTVPQKTNHRWPQGRRKG